MDRRSPPASVVLFGCGSPMIVDVEESCGRLGLAIAAIVKNMDGPDHALSRARIVKADAIDPVLKGCPYAVPFFTPNSLQSGLSFLKRSHPTSVGLPSFGMKRIQQMRSLGHGHKRPPMRSVSRFNLIPCKM